MSKTRRKMTEHQTDILYNIAIEESSVSSLAKKMQKEKSNLHKPMTILKEKHMIEVVRKEQNVGQEEIFYGLTGEGIHYLVKSRLNAKEFLEILFNIYNKFPNHQLEVSIDQVFSEYEKTNMPFPGEFTPLVLRNLLPYYPSLPDMYEDHKAILRSIAHGGPLTEIQLRNRFDLKKPNGSILEDMMNSMMITHSDSKSNKIRLSNIGNLLLLDQIMTANSTNFDYGTNNLIGRASEFFNKLRIDYRDTMPHIFREWEKLSAIQGDRIVIESVVSAIHRLPIDLIHNKMDNYQRISYILELMANSHIDFARNLVTACIDMLCQILNFPKDKSLVKEISLWIAAGKNAEPPRMRKDIFQKLDPICKCVETIEKQSNFLPFDESKKLLDQVGLSTNWKVRTSVLEPNIESQITFLFFTMFKQKLEEKSFLDLHGISLSFGVSAETSRNMVLKEEKSRQDKIKKYNKFLTEKRISKQYNKMIDQIIEFESQNINELKALKIEQ